MKVKTLKESAKKTNDEICRVACETVCLDIV